MDVPTRARAVPGGIRKRREIVPAVYGGRGGRGDGIMESRQSMFSLSQGLWISMGRLVRWCLPGPLLPPRPPARPTVRVGDAHRQTSLWTPGPAAAGGRAASDTWCPVRSRGATLRHAQQHRRLPREAPVPTSPQQWALRRVRARRLGLCSVPLWLAAPRRPTSNRVMRLYPCEPTAVGQSPSCPPNIVGRHLVEKGEKQRIKPSFLNCSRTPLITPPPPPPFAGRKPVPMSESRCSCPRSASTTPRTRPS